MHQYKVCIRNSKSTIRAANLLNKAFTELFVEEYQSIDRIKYIGTSTRYKDHSYIAFLNITRSKIIYYMIHSRSHRSKVSVNVCNSRLDVIEKSKGIKKFDP